MLSKRGAQWSHTEYTHGKQNLYHPVRNPNGVVSFANAENVTSQSCCSSKNIIKLTMPVLDAPKARRLHQLACKANDEIEHRVSG